MPRSKAKRRADREQRKRERQHRGDHKIFDTKPVLTDPKPRGEDHALQERT